MLKRRGFLSCLAGFAAAAVLDPERALWVRGAKTISIAKPRPPIFMYHGNPVFDFGDMGIGSNAYQSGWCLEKDLPTILRKYGDFVDIHQVPIKGNEHLYDRMAGIERLHHPLC